MTYSSEVSKSTNDFTQNPRNPKIPSIVIEARSCGRSWIPADTRQLIVRTSRSRSASVIPSGMAGKR